MEARLSKLILDILSIYIRAEHMNNEKLKDTLKSINWNHGRGDIRKIEVFAFWDIRK